MAQGDGCPPELFAFLGVPSALAVQGAGCHYIFCFTTSDCTISQFFCEKVEVNNV